MNISYEQYDTLIGQLHGVSHIKGNFENFLNNLCRFSESSAVGIALCDRKGGVWSFSVLGKPHLEPIKKVYRPHEYGEARKFVRQNFPRAARLNDVVPRGELKNLPWYRYGLSTENLQYYMFGDIFIESIKIRTIIARKSTDKNFNSRDCDFLDRVQGHLQVSTQRMGIETLMDGLKESEFSSGNFRSIEFSTIIENNTDIESILRSAYGLSAAECRVVTAMTGGCPVKTAADSLNISANTLKTHLKRIYLKTGVSRRVELLLKINHIKGQGDASRSSPLFRDHRG